MVARRGNGIVTVARRAAVSNNPALLYPRRGRDTRRASCQFPSSHLPPQRSIMVPRRGVKGFFKKVGRVAKKIAKPVHKVTHTLSGIAKDLLKDVPDPRVQGALKALETVDAVSGGISSVGGRKELAKQAREQLMKKGGRAARRIATGKSTLRSELEQGRDDVAAAVQDNWTRARARTGYGRRRGRY